MSDRPDLRIVKKAAGKAIDPDRLLPGERPEAADLDDVKHWVGVYTELLAIKARILDAASQTIEEVRHHEVGTELRNDQTILLAELARFQRRLDYWHSKQTEMEGGLK